MNLAFMKKQINDLFFTGIDDDILYYINYYSLFTKIVSKL